MGAASPVDESRDRTTATLTAPLDLKLTPPKPSAGPACWSGVSAFRVLAFQAASY